MGVGNEVFHELFIIYQLVKITCQQTCCQLLSEPVSHLLPLSVPQYSVYCCILSLIACGVFLRVSFELKVLFLTVASVAYYVIILSTKRALFVAYGNFLCNSSSLNCSRLGPRGEGCVTVSTWP